MAGRRPTGPCGPARMRHPAGARGSNGGSMFDLFARFSRVVARGLGHPVAFVVSLLLVAGWALCGPLFHYSAGGQLVINTGTTIATFLMVFVLQNSQNRDSRALQMKVDEL